MRIIGIDPGMAIVGYCIMDYDKQNYENANTLVSCGSIQTDKNLTNSQRLLEIYKDLTELLNKFKPDVASVEQLFYFKNAKTLVPVAQARGVILMTIESLGIPLYEYTPLVVKQTITGYGRAQKEEVKDMVKILLKSDSQISKLDDTTDAIAIALCHTMCGV